MTIKNWLIRGDTHGGFTWIYNQLKDYSPEETAVIILGDAGFNFYLNKTDERTKREVNVKGYYIYCVRGNHECRPQNLDTMENLFDKNVDGWVYYEPNYPHIRYFRDYGIYNINNYRCLVIGGAYSVDKWWRLANAGIEDPIMNIPKKTGWFADECLTEQEMKNCEILINESGDNHFDFILSHTCPKKYQPVDLFLGFVDQSTVDTTMEDWMDKISEKIVVKYAWLFGHYHRDRLERPHVEQYFNDIETINDIAHRWEWYDMSDELDWWLVKSPNFYME